MMLTKLSKNIHSQWIYLLLKNLNEKKRKLFNKIPEDTIFRKHIPKQVELDKFIDALKEKVIHDYNIPYDILKALRAEYKRSPYFRDICHMLPTVPLAQVIKFFIL